MFSFLNYIPDWKAGLLAAGIAVPLLLVLYFLKLRRREMEVSSTLLWKKAVQDLQVNAPFQRLRRNLLLFMQLLLLLLLAAALARPIAHYKPGAGKLNVLLIDRSASMQTVEKEYGGRSRLDEAKRRARDVVDSMRRGDAAVVVAFDDAPQIVCPSTGDAARLRSAIDSIEPTDRRTRLKDTYKIAEAQAFFDENQKRPDEKPDVFLFSDGRALDSDELSLHGELHYEMVGTDQPDNVGIVALSAKRNYERPTELQVFARLANYGPEPVEADVQLDINGEERGSAEGADAVFLLPERWNDQQRETYERENHRQAKDSVEFPRIDLPGSAVIRIQQMHPDALGVDDSASVVVPPAKALSVLLVTDGNYFLERMVDSLGLKNPDHMLPQYYEEKKPTTYDVIIFDRVEPVWLPPAGNFISFGAVPPGLKLKAVTDGPDKRPVLLQESTVLDWKRDHPILQHLSLGKIYVGESLKLDVPFEGDDVLVEGTRGPLVVMERTGRSTHLVVAFDLLQSNWPLRVSFPHFMHNALQYLAIGSDMDVRESYEPGAIIKLPRANLQRLDPAPTSITLRGPTGVKTIPVPPDGDVVLPALDKVGVYSLDPPVPQFEKIAVNMLDANESNIVPVTSPPGDIGHNVAMKGGKARLELWWWIVACGALPLAMLEWWVYTRRVHM